MWVHKCMFPHFYFHSSYYRSCEVCRNVCIDCTSSEIVCVFRTSMLLSGTVHTHTHTHTHTHIECLINGCDDLLSIRRLFMSVFFACISLCMLLLVSDVMLAFSHDWCTWQTCRLWIIFHVVGAAHLYKYWPLVRFPPTVGECDASRRNRRFYFSPAYEVESCCCMSTAFFYNWQVNKRLCVCVCVCRVSSRRPVTTYMSRGKANALTRQVPDKCTWVWMSDR